MRKNAFNSKDHIPAINRFRIAMNGAKFTKEQLIAVFKESGIPTNGSFWSAFRKSGIIKQVGKNEFVFSSSQPVYHGDLNKVYRQYHATVKNYRKNTHKPAPEPRPKQEEEQKPNPEEELLAMESFAIDFLKDLGYKILAPVGIVYQSI